MTLVGNDIVDLGDPENRGKSRDRRFVARVFTGGEQERIAATARPDTLLWALWAAKEAAYKAFSRGVPEIASIPKLYQVFFEGEAAFADPADAALPCKLAGRVIAPPGELALRVHVTDRYVHVLAAATPETLAGIRWGVLQIDAARPAEDPPALARRGLLAEIAARTGCPAGALSIRKGGAGSGAPVVFCGDRMVTAALSLSHDGRFAAFALDAAAL